MATNFFMKHSFCFFAFLFFCGIAIAQNSNKVVLKLNCAPLEYNPKIYSKPNLSAIHSNWLDGEVGTSFSFSSSKKLENENGIFLFGDLYSPKGNIITKNCYILLSEWECSN